MDLHISTEEESGLRTLRVSGQLDLVGLGELRRASRGAARLRLDLTRLWRADAAALDLLAAMRRDGVELVGTPPYIDLLLGARSAPPLTANDTEGEPR